MKKNIPTDKPVSIGKRFANFNKSAWTFKENRKPYIVVYTLCMLATLKWDLWLKYSPTMLLIIVGCYITIAICYFIPSLKKYNPLLDIAIFFVYFPSYFIIDAFKGKEYIYVIMATGLFVYAGPQIGKLDIISVRLRKWLFFMLILFSVGFLVYVFDKTTSISIKIASIVVLLINSVWFYYMNNIERKEKEKELEQLKQAQTQAKLSSLKDQLSPHFLFNTLNTITSISHEETVKDFVDEVANIYRYVLQFNEVDSVKIKQEIDFITSYLNIIKSRMEGGIDFYINITNDRILYTSMPPLTLQILVENAIKHNTTSADKPLSINIFTTEGPMLVVQNYYQPKLSVLPGNETGLKNIAERYRLLYKKEIVVENKNGFFTVKLPIVMA